MRRWLSFATAFAFLLCANMALELREHRLLPTSCPEDTVCLTFGERDCTVNGKSTNSFVWPSEQDPNKLCGGSYTYSEVYVNLRITPINSTNWKFDGEFLVLRSYTEYKAQDFTFNFGNAELKFLENNALQFSWNRDGVSKTSDHGRVKEDYFESKWWIGKTYGFDKITFNINTPPDVKLVELIGEKVTFTRAGDDPKNIVISGSDLRDQINPLTPCPASEIIQRTACHDSCDEIFQMPKLDSNSTNTTTNSTSPVNLFKTNCPSLLWFHLPSESGMTRHWKKVDDQIKCHDGSWVANYTAHESGKPARGTHKFNSSEEIQCSALHPEELTTQGKVVIGVAAGIGGLLAIGIVVLLILCLLRKRRRRKAKKFQFGADTTFGTGTGTDSRMQMPDGKSTEREGTLRAVDSPGKGSMRNSMKNSSPAIATPPAYENHIPGGTPNNVA